VAKTMQSRFLICIPTKHGVTKLQFTWHRSDLQFKFSAVWHYNAGTAGLVVVNGG